MKVELKYKDTMYDGQRVVDCFDITASPLEILTIHQALKRLSRDSEIHEHDRISAKKLADEIYASFSK